MKLIFAIVHNDDAPIVTSELNKAGFHSTKIASTGGFLSSGNTTFITGVDDDKVQSVVDLISAHSKRHSQYGADHRLSVARHGRRRSRKRPRCRPAARPFSC